MEKYVVTYVETSDTCDGKARVAGVFDSKEKAREVVRENMQWYCTNNDDIEVFWDRMSAWNSDGSRGCEWNISPVTI
jgi:hypothetical protein